MNTFLKDDGSPDISHLVTAFNRCAPTAPGGLAWLDQVRDCRWPGMFTDGRKHNISGDPLGEAKPWDGASDCRPFVVDDLINEHVDVDVVAFWRAMLQQASGGDEADGYAVALAEWLIFKKLFAMLLDEVELSSQYRHAYGWCILAPRWRRELAMRRYTLTLQQFTDAAQEATQQIQQTQAKLQQKGLTDPTQVPAQIQAQLQQLKETADLPGTVMDPSREDEAVQYLLDYYDGYIKSKLPDDMADRAPKLDPKKVRSCVQDLRAKGTCTVALPYLCKNEPEIYALKPYEEIAIPNERTNGKELGFEIEWVTEATLKGRIITEDYDPVWVEEASKHKGSWAPQQLQVATQPIGLNGLLAQGAAAPLADAAMSVGMDSQYIRIIHAIYREADSEGVPAVYITTFHTDVRTDSMKGDLFAKHGLMDGADSEVPNVELLRERRSRSLTQSRSITELAHTDQNQIKGIRDGILDRQSITTLPPVNIYESPTGANYRFGPATRNYVKSGKEPAFMETPTGQGMADAVESHGLITNNLNGRFTRMAAGVEPMRVQTGQENRTRRFLVSWTQAIKLALNFYQRYGDDEEFSEITGAPEGWLDSHRNDTGLFSAALDFDVRELDPELMMKRIEIMNQMVLPNDTLGVIQRGKWSAIMARWAVGPSMAKQIVQTLPDASQALFDKANDQILKMYAGNQPTLVDENDPTAKSLLDFTQQIVMNNPNYLRALDDVALTTLAGQNAQQVAQQIGPRKPDELFSGLLVKWLKNLQFIGVTQVKNKQTGALGVDASQQGAPAPAQ